MPFEGDCASREMKNENHFFLNEPKLRMNTRYVEETKSK